MKKKMITLALSMVLVASTLTACSNAASTSNPSAEASSEVVESKESTSAEASSEVASSESKESGEFKYSNKTHTWTFSNGDGETRQFVYIDDETKSDCITQFSIDGTSNYSHAFYWEGPTEIGSKGGVYDVFVGLTNQENNLAILYSWDTTPTETILGESDDSDYDLMISNGQFTFYFPSDYDQEKAKEVFATFRAITIDEARTLNNEMVAIMQPKESENGEFKYDVSSAKSSFASMNGENNQFIRLDDKTMSDCVTLFSVDGTSNYTNAFYWEGPSEIGTKGNVLDGFVVLINQEDTLVVLYSWNTTPTETIYGVSDEDGYDLMISNGQFKFYYPNSFDQEKAQEVFDSFKALTVDEANALVGDMKEAIKFSN